MKRYCNDVDDDDNAQWNYLGTLVECQAIMLSFDDTVSNLVYRKYVRFLNFVHCADSTLSL